MCKEDKWVCILLCWKRKVHNLTQISVLFGGFPNYYNLDNVFAGSEGNCVLNLWTRLLYLGTAKIFGDKLGDF